MYVGQHEVNLHWKAAKSGAKSKESLQGEKGGLWIPRVLWAFWVIYVAAKTTPVFSLARVL